MVLDSSGSFSESLWNKGIVLGDIASKRARRGIWNVSTGSTGTPNKTNHLPKKVFEGATKVGRIPYQSLSNDCLTYSQVQNLCTPRNCFLQTSPSLIFCHTAENGTEPTRISNQPPERIMSSSSVCRCYGILEITCMLCYAMLCYNMPCLLLVIFGFGGCQDGQSNYADHASNYSKETQYKPCQERGCARRCLNGMEKIYCFGTKVNECSL